MHAFTFLLAIVTFVIHLCYGRGNFDFFSRYNIQSSLLYNVNGGFIFFSNTWFFLHSLFTKSRILINPRFHSQVC